MSSSPSRPADLHQRRYAARTARANATKARVVHAATRLFTERGYLYTTMADIAGEASVAVQTLYLSFGGKAQILSAALDRAVAGDDEALAVLERPWVTALREEPDLRQALRLLVAEGTAIVARATPVYLRVQEACADAEVAEVLATQRARRHQVDLAAAAMLAAKPGFASGLTIEAAGDIIYAVLSEDAYRLFCLDRGWELSQWQAWSLTVLEATLAGETAPAELRRRDLSPVSAVILKTTGNLRPRGGKLADSVSGPLRALVESMREQVMAIAARHHASRVRPFGSAARGDDRPDSDIDLLVDFDQESSLFDLMRMERDLEALLGRRVDVVSAGGLKSRDSAILAESVDL